MVLIVCVAGVVGLSVDSAAYGACTCLGDMTGDSWLSPVDVSLLVSKLLRHRDNSYWMRAPEGTCGDLDNDQWLSPIDVNALVSILLPHEDNSYWLACE